METELTDELKIEHHGRVYFNHAELACRLTGHGKLASGFADALLKLRLAYGKPMVVTSCCRSAEHNKDIGGHPHSLHIYDYPEHNVDGACAIDIGLANGSHRWILVNIATAQGWSIGVATTFLHLDRRDLAGLAQPVVFGYGNR